MTAIVETIPAHVVVPTDVLAGPPLSDLTPGTKTWALRWLAEARAALWHSYNESPEQVQIQYAKHQFWCNRKELAALEFERLLDIGDTDETWRLLGTDHDTEFTMRAYYDADGVHRHTLAPVKYVEGTFCEVEEDPTEEPAMAGSPTEKPEARAVYARKKLRCAMYDLHYGRAKLTEGYLPYAQAWLQLWTDEAHGGDGKAALAELEAEFGTMEKLFWVDAEGVDVTPKPGTGFFCTITENGLEEAPPPAYLRPDGTETTQATAVRRTVPGAYYALKASLEAYRAAQKGTQEEMTETKQAPTPEDMERWKARDALMDPPGSEVWPGEADRSKCVPEHPKWISWHQMRDQKEADKAEKERIKEEARQNSPLYRACLAITEWQPRDREMMLIAPPLRMLVEELIPAGKVGTVVSAGGTGKTSLLMKLGISIATGQAWFERKVLERGTTVLLSGEDEQDDLDAALAELLKVQVEWIMCATKGTEKQRRHKAEDYLEMVRQRVRLISLRGWVPAFTKRTERGSGFEIDTEVRENLASALAEIPDLRLIIPDTLRRFAQAPSIDEEAMAKAISVAEYFSEAIRSKPTVIVPHHTTKESFRKGVTDQYAAHGSGVTVDNTRFGINFRELGDKEIEETFANAPEEIVPGSTYLYAEPSRGSLRMKKAQPFYIRRTGWAFSLARPARRSPEERAQDADRAVLERIAEMEDQGVAAITGALVFATVPCKNGKEGARLKELAVKGLVLNRNAGGKTGLGADWRLTEDGRKAIGPSKVQGGG